MSMSWQSRLKQRDLKRMSKQKHRPCPDHGPVREVCPQCVKVICPACGHECEAPVVRSTPSSYAPPPELNTIWKVLKELGAEYLDEHVDSGHWMAIFPPRYGKTSSAGELADRVWADNRMKLQAKPTAYRAGRLLKPERWWVSFELKGVKE